MMHILMYDTYLHEPNSKCIIRNKALVKLPGGLEDYKKKVLKDMMGKKKR